MDYIDENDSESWSWTFVRSVLIIGLNVVLIGVGALSLGALMRYWFPV